jgi:hypothetical protein
MLLIGLGCAQHVAHPSGSVSQSKTTQSEVGCVAEVQEAEDEPCLVVALISGECRSPDAVRAEQEWLWRRYPGYQLLSQAVTSPALVQPHKVLDHLRIRTPDDQELGFCFDITAFW